MDRGVTDALARLLEEVAGRALTLPLLLKLPGETRDPEAEDRALPAGWPLRPKEFLERRGDGFAAEPPGLRLRLEGLIVGFIVAEPEGVVLCKPELLTVGLTSGCRACMVSSPRRDASVRRRATLEI